jgi:NADPH:quinone reductase-like Zn-dependent oxidoreductase
LIRLLSPGTGGVSIFGLQFAFAAGGHPVITSSTTKNSHVPKPSVQRRRSTTNRHPEWSKAMLEATNGLGAHHILEVGGSGTLPQSLACVAPGGNVALIGGLSGFGGEVPVLSLIGRSASVTGIFVGSRADFETMLQFMTRHAIRPVIDRRFHVRRCRGGHSITWTPAITSASSSDLGVIEAFLARARAAGEPLVAAFIVETRGFDVS